MDGPTLVNIIEPILKSRKIPKHTFYQATGISSATFSQWRNGTCVPSSSGISKAEDFLGLSFESTITVQKKSAPTIEDGLSKLELEALEIIKSLSDDELERYIQIGRIAFGKDGSGNS